MSISTPETPAGRATPQVVPFSKIAGAMARACHDAGAMRALVATVVAVGPDDRLDGAMETLQSLGDAGTVRGIMISAGGTPAPEATVAGNTVSLRGIKPDYVNNAVAALRLSSLPTVVWWRGGSSDLLEGIAELADRVVLDETQPEDGWKRAMGLWEESAFSDLRWARLTQWRALTAHFFDIPEVRTASRSFTRLRIAAADRTAAQLFAAWLTSSMPFAPGFRVDIEDAGNTSGGSALQMVHLADGQQGLTIQLETERKCLQTSVSVRGHRSASRVVSMVDQSLTSLMTEELRIRARDLAMERAIASLVGG